MSTFHDYENKKLQCLYTYILVFVLVFAYRLQGVCVYEMCDFMRHPLARSFDLILMKL